MITLLLNGTHLSISEAEAAIVKPLVEELEGLGGMPFSPDPPPWGAVPPAHVLTPSRIVALVHSRLGPLDRREDIARRILDALTVNGLPFAGLR